MAPGAESFVLLSLLRLFGSSEFILSCINLQKCDFLKTLSVVIIHRFENFLTHEWKILYLQLRVWKQISHTVCTNKSRPSLTSVPENLTGAEWTILWPVPGYCSPDSTPGVDSVFGMHKYPSCGLDMTAQHIAFFRHKLSLKNLCLMLCCQYFCIWVVFTWI